ncbi:hypothetical protein B0H67DRAFT_87481 [Lasiosphaeris hirsuta]|uniref:Uncharacterized protein n=1 Tax=Lasiosphaeris hirsuta TaxID=260670 RepID=A0AA40BCK6_9PEZI|nr:hypothetical protein B0H67DRAFT_87481 [Lasiosphaeris hirsuta]
MQHCARGWSDSIFVFAASHDDGLGKPALRSGHALTFCLGPKSLAQTLHPCTACRAQGSIPAQGVSGRWMPHECPRRRPAAQQALQRRHRRLRPELVNKTGVFHQVP